MDYYECKMEMALAEILGVNFDIVEMLNLSIEYHTGKDDFFYGYYVNFPNKRDIDENILSNLEQSDINKIPWGETEYYSEAQFGNTNVDPFGWKEEDEEYDYYLNTEVSKDNVLIQLNKIESIIREYSDNEIIIKSLIFSAFSITENYIKHLVTKSIPDYNNSNADEKIKLFLKDEIANKLFKEDSRKNLFKRFTNNKLKGMPFIKIRNYLAHSMFEVQINNYEIIYDNKRKDIFTIINELKNYINKPYRE